MHWVGDRLKGLSSTSLSDIAIGEAKLVTIDGEKVAAYRDDDGVMHTISAICSHLGCIVARNNAEKSWDCLCHGSRFNCEGEVLNASAIKDLEAKLMSYLMIFRLQCNIT